MNALRSFLSCASLCLAVFVLSSCGSPLVGLECRDGLERCGRACYDFTNDRRHCGGCNIACSADQQCIDSLCMVPADPGDGAVGDGGDSPEAGRGDGGVDGGGDGGDHRDPDSGYDAGWTDDLDGGRDARAGEGGLDGAASDARTDATPGDGGPPGDGSNPSSDGGPSGDGSNPTGDGGPSGDGGPAGDGGTPLPELCTGPPSPEDCVCDLGQLKCNNICVDANTDRNNCGGCGTVCELTEYCAVGICAPICAPPLTLCSGLCVNLLESDAFCGSCTIACDQAAACIDGTCVGRAVGHIVLFGHDMSAARAPMQTMVGNAVFLPRRTPLRVLAYDEFTSGPSRAGVSAAIQAAAQARTYSFISANPSLLIAQLANADVFVIEAQHTATDARLRELGSMWSAALSTFLFRGGVIVVFDAGGSHAGTHQILEGAGLYNVTARMPLTRRRLALATASDAIAASVPTEYQAEGETAGFDVDLVADPATVVVRDPMTMLPVVLHRVVVE